VKFGGIQVDDSDFRRARITVIVISILIVIPIALSLAKYL
jgi:hypothetical protein